MNEIFHSFNSFSSKFSLGNRLLDIFPSYFSFYLLERKNIERKKAYIYKLNKIILQILADSRIAVIISNVSIKNQVVMFIAHIHIYNKSVIKILYHTITTSTEAELFAIRCRLNQAIQLDNIEYIIVITDFIYVVKRIFDSSIHLY